VISVCILAKNSQRSIASTLASLSRFDEVILLDTGSTDQTMDLAKTYSNVQVRQTPFSHFGPLRNQAAQMAKNDWILAVDSDEVLSTELQDEILSLALNSNTVYEIDFHNYYNCKRIMGCGWHPESHIRLYNKRATRFSDSSIHEGVIAKGLQIEKLRSPLLHTPYLSVSDFLAKMQLYSDLFAQEKKGKLSASFAKALTHASAAFFKSYIFKYGILMGKEGAIISFYNASMAFYKYLKLAEANRTLS
jgi:glycosyltransferase involved in cell wall biosynthesis